MELFIEKLVYGGDGLARLISANEQRPKAIFVPYVLPAEQVEARIVEDRAGFSRAILDRVLQASTLRVEPACPYFGKCGGCHYQHTSYVEQLRLKGEILRETLRRTAKMDLPFDVLTHASPPWHYRNRTRFHLRSKPDFAIGYFRHGSNELLPVRECPISSPLINRALQELWKAGEAGRLRSEVNQIELFANASDDRLMIELYLRTGTNDVAPLRQFATTFAEAIPEVHGVANIQLDFRSRSELKVNVLLGERAMDYMVAKERYRVSAGAFFQTNRHLLPRMVELAVGDRTGRVALDLYSGVGLFALPLARKFARVIAVECAPSSGADLRANVPENVRVSLQGTEQYLTSVANTLNVDLVVVDPPRSGLGERVCKQIGDLGGSEIVYVSCDPATLARDLKQLTSAAWKISAMHLIDVFPQTFHIETCTVLTR